MANGKVILITGCSSGMGMGAAVAFAKKGYKVYATMRNPGKKGDLERALDEARVSASILPLDVTREETIGGCVSTIERQEGRLDVLINNAAYSLAGPLEACTVEEIKSLFETNFFGAVRCIHAVLPVMRRQKSGLIVNVSGVGGFLGSVPLSSVYISAKFAIEGMSESLHEELKLFGIKVRIIVPGGVTTSLGANRKQGTRLGQSDQTYDEVARWRQQAMSALPQRKPMTPLEAAETFVRAVEDSSEQFRFYMDEGSEANARRKMVDPLKITPFA